MIRALAHNISARTTCTFLLGLALHSLMSPHVAAQSRGIAKDDRRTTPVVIMVAGQSNASGRGELNGSTESSDARVTMFANDYTWKTAYEPVDDPSGQLDVVSDDTAFMAPGRGHSFALKGAKDMLTSATAVQLIPCAKGGTGVGQWLRGANPLDRNTLFGSMNNRAKTATSAPLDAMWWYQGESDWGNSVYVEEHRLFVEQVREELGPGLPFVYVQLARHGDASVNMRIHRVAELQRLMESGSGHEASLQNHHMVVSFDLPMVDLVHLNQEAQKELGRRVGLATREHVFQEEVDGTGPRLLKDAPVLLHPSDARKIIVRFDKMINETANNYDNLFRVYDATDPITILRVVRDTADSRNAVIELAEILPIMATVAYGDVPASGNRLLNVIKGATGLPTPRFGPLSVRRFFEEENRAPSGWMLH